MKIAKFRLEKQRREEEHEEAMRLVCHNFVFLFLTLALLIRATLLTPQLRLSKSWRENRETERGTESATKNSPARFSLNRRKGDDTTGHTS